MYFLENQDETRDFLTCYQKDIGSLKRVPKVFKAQSCAPEGYETNPITDAYEELLHTKSKNARLPYIYRSANAEEIYKKMRKDYCHMRKLLPEQPPDEKVIDRENKKLLYSIYQLSYGKNLDAKGEKNYIDLPINTLVPETVSRQAYRDFKHFGTINYSEKNVAKPIDNIVVDMQEREILRVRTGDSEYQAMINKLGDRVMNEQFFGPPIPIDPPEEQIKAPSLCSKILLHAAKRHVLSQIM